MTKKRTGTFSSSNAWRLMTNNKKGEPFGVPALKYIKQVNYEIKLGREIGTEHESRTTTWGLAVQRHVFNILHMSYVWMDGQRFFHPELKRWSGSPDTLKGTTVGDVKCPTLEVFCDKVELLQKCCDAEDLTAYKEAYPEDYWQHISNAILLQGNGKPCKYFEAIIYCPYRSELEVIREMILMMDDNDAYKWICFAPDNQLPWIPDGGHYRNLNVFRFEIPAEEKITLHNRIKLGHEMINEPKLIAV